MIPNFSCTNIRKTFGLKEVLKGVSLKLEKGTILGLIGPSGSGKSILLKIFSGVIAASSGEILPLCEEVSIGLMFQEGALFDSMTVFDNIAFPLVQGNVPSSNLPQDKLIEVHSRVEKILKRVGLVKAAYKLPGQLSGGMRKRVSLARALVSRPQFLFLDDPTAGLDPIASNVILDLIGDIHAEYSPTTILVSHDLRRLLPRVTEVMALFDGQVKFLGSLSELENQSCSELSTFVRSRYSFSPCK